MPNVYRNINLGAIVLIGIVFCYSYFFYPNNHPLDCVIKKQTGKNCSSCGISRAFSNFTHLHFDEGKQYNKHAFVIFIYFLVQFVFRVILVLTKKTHLKIYFYIDIIFTIIGFLISFTPMLVEQFILFN